LLIGSGLAAALAALGGFASQYSRDVHDAESKRCEIAAGVLQDDKPSPFLGQADRDKVIASAAWRFVHCMENQE
jgi:hypothetical protein